MKERREVENRERGRGQGEHNQMEKGKDGGRGAINRTQKKGEEEGGGTRIKER